MINILDFYKNNLTYRNLIFKKMSFLNKSVFILLLVAFLVNTFIALIFLLDGKVILGSRYFLLAIILEILLLIINHNFIKEVMKKSENYDFDHNYGIKENLKIYKSHILLKYLYNCDISSKEQLETFKQLVKQEKELSKYGYKYTLSILIASIISIIGIIASFYDNTLNLLISLSIIIIVVSIVATIENFGKQLRLFGITKESKYINILILINIGLLNFNKRNNINKRKSYTIFE